MEGLACTDLVARTPIGVSENIPLLQAELLKAGIELGLYIFCVDSYVSFKEIFRGGGSLL